MTQISARKQGYTATVVAGCFAVLLAQVAYSLPGALNGTFQQEFGTTGAQLTWVTAAFAIPMVVLELTTGVIGDLFGRKRLLQAGALLTVAGSVVSYFAGTVQVLWIGQVVAGVGAAISPLLGGWLAGRGVGGHRTWWWSPRPWYRSW